MLQWNRVLCAALALTGLALLAPGVAVAAPPVVHAVLFYMTTCDHCHTVIEEDLPPILDRFGDQLVIAYVDVEGGGALDLFYDAMDAYGVPSEEQGVPIVIVGEQLLNGGVEIPTLLEGVVEEGLTAGGVDWPDLPRLEAVLAEQAEMHASEPEPTAASGSVDPVSTAAALTGAATAGAPVEPTAAVGSRSLPDLTAPSVRERWAADPTAFGITAVVLVFMVASGLWIAGRWMRHGFATDAAGRSWAWVIPLLCALGVVVAAYLAYVETTSSKAVCGPVGDCNAVQQSEYASLFGVLPIGVLGLLGYAVIGVVWAWRRRANADLARRTKWILPAILLFGVVFSVYLTLLELFVIHAICMWCVTSAVIMTLLLWAVSLGWAEPRPASGRGA